jgi:hypothetical protein
VCCGNQRSGRRTDRPPSFQVVLAMEKLNKRSTVQVSPLPTGRATRTAKTASATSSTWGLMLVSPRRNRLQQLLG